MLLNCAVLLFIDPIIFEMIFHNDILHCTLTVGLAVDLIVHKNVIFIDL